MFKLLTSIKYNRKAFTDAKMEVQAQSETQIV